MTSYLNKTAEVRSAERALASDREHSLLNGSERLSARERTRTCFGGSSPSNPKWRRMCREVDEEFDYCLRKLSGDVYCLFLILYITLVLILHF